MKFIRLTADNLRQYIGYQIIFKTKLKKYYILKTDKCILIIYKY
jgi:hypothetical protein